MPNVTISIDDKLLKKGRKYAEKRGTSLNALIRDLLKKKVDQKSHQRAVYNKGYIPKGIK